MIFDLITNGSIIRLKNDNTRDWVCIHYTNCNMSHRAKFNKNIKNHTGYYLFGGLWNEGNALTDKPYCKCIERLEKGMLNNIDSIVGHISNNSDYAKYKEFERL